MVWLGVREHRGWVFIGARIAALGAYGFVATLQPDAQFGRILAAYGGVFVAGSLAWGMVADGFRPDRFDIVGALVCLLGVAAVFEDALAGVAAGRAGRFGYVVGVDRLGQAVALRDRGADIVVGDLGELL